MKRIAFAFIVIAFLLSPFFGSSVLAQAPTPSSCAPSKETSAANCSGTISTSDYVIPLQCLTGTSSPDKPCSDFQGTYKDPTVGDRYVGGVRTYIYKQPDGNFFVGFYDKHIILSRDGKILEDTTSADPKNPLKCAGTGKSAYYKIFDPGTGAPGATFVPPQMTCGVDVTTTSRLEAYSYPEGDPTCTTTNETTIGTTRQLIYQGPGMCNGRKVDAIVVATTGGAGAGEAYVYCKGLGPCAVYGQIGAAAPGGWGASTDLCNLPITGTKTPIGEFMDNSTGDAPLTKVETREKEALGSTVSDFGQSLDFPSASFPNFSKEDNKFTEMFDPNLGGGELVPATLQEKVTYPDQQADYTGYNEVYASGCVQVQFAGGKKKDEQKSQYAAESDALPQVYPRTQASFNILGSIRAKEQSGLQYRAQQPAVFDPADCNKIKPEYVLFDCGAQTNRKLVASVPIKVSRNVVQKAVATVEEAISDVVGTISDVACTIGDVIGICKKKTANLVVTKTATVFLPGAKDIENKAVGDDNGSLLTFFPSAVTDKLSKVNACTKEGAEEGECADEDIPHYQMHAVKDTFTKTSSCMLLPASVQADRKTDCKLAEAKEPTPAPSRKPAGGAPNCNMDRFSDSPPPTAGGGNGGPIGKYSGFTIPYRDTSCTIASDKLPAIAEQAVRWSAYVQRNPDLAEKARQNVINVFPLIQQKAVEYGWNPAFVLALWIEETAVGQDGDYAMGCIYGLDKNLEWYRMAPKSDGCQAAACLFSYPVKNPNNFEEFMCAYETGDRTCSKVAANIPPGRSWGWANSVNLAYTLISERAGFASSCWLRE